MGLSMIYFISEDSNSAHIFWLAVFNTFAKNYKEINTNINGDVVYGNTSLEEKVDNALNLMKKGDALFIAFDNIGSPLQNNGSTFDSGDFIFNTSAKCKLKSIELLLSNYYCFEEVYITYVELERLCKEDNKQNGSMIADVLKYVRYCIDNDIEYYDKNNVYVKYIISLVPNAGINKEHFDDALLRQATASIKNGLFSIKKEGNGLGECWITSCEEIRDRKKNSKVYSTILHFCKNCKFKLSNAYSKEKLIHINKNSILRFADTDFEQLENYT